MRDLVESHVGFVTPLKPNFDMCRDMVRDHVDDLGADRRVLHNDRFMRVYSQERTLTCTTRKVWLHLILDEDEKYNVERTAFRKLQNGEMGEDEYRTLSMKAGLFILVSSMWIDRDDIIPLYFERGGIERLIDIGKTNGRMSRVAVHSEEAFSGKILLDFATLSVNQMLQNHLKRRKEALSSKKRKHKDSIPGRNLSAPHALYILRNQKCDVFENRLIPRERTKVVNEVYELFGYRPPAALEHPGDD